MIVGWISGVSEKNRLPSGELTERMGFELVYDVVKRNRWRWLGHVL